jgi:phosphate-selective porin OprO/OprP
MTGRSHQGRKFNVIRKPYAAVALSLAGALVASQAQAQSASSSEQEIALLKQQLRLME